MFNKIPCIKNRNISDSFENLESLVNYIKSKDRIEFKAIKKAREAGKGSNLYNGIKKGSIPCVAVNFTFNKSVRNSNLLSPTGFLYMDVDGTRELDIDFTYVAAYWKSLSNNGYSIILKVKGLNPLKLKASYETIGLLTGIEYDKQAISRDRLTVLSHDSNAYYNDKAEILDISKDELYYDNNIKTTLSHSSDCDSTVLNYNNLEEVIANLPYQITYNNEGYYDFGKDKLEYSKAYFPFGVVAKGRRNSILSMFMNQLIALNRNFPIEKFISLAMFMNNKKNFPALDKVEVLTIVKSKFVKRSKLQLVINATRRFLFDPEAQMTTKQKRGVCFKVCNKLRTEETKAKIRKAILDWTPEDGYMSIRKIAKKAKVSNETVRKYKEGIIYELIS
ncbi:MAG: hypothetical protein ACJAXV_000326 [Bacteroidia bacterium]|jgi:hypothetical protein